MYQKYSVKLNTILVKLHEIICFAPKCESEKLGLFQCYEVLLIHFFLTRSVFYHIVYFFVNIPYRRFSSKHD